MKKAIKNTEEAKEKKMALGIGNYKLMLVAFGLIVLGFILMIGGGSKSPDEFNYDMFSFRRITLAPILAVGGFAFMIYAIMKKFDKKSGK